MDMAGNGLVIVGRGSLIEETLSTGLAPPADLNQSPMSNHLTKDRTMFENFKRFRNRRQAARPLAFKDDATGFNGWRVRLEQPRPIPTPAIAADRLFVEGGFGSYDFYAFDARTGAQVWHLGTTDDGPTAAVLTDGLAVFNTESCTLEVVEAATGRVVWEKWLGDP